MAIALSGDAALVWRKEITFTGATSPVTVNSSTELTDWLDPGQADSSDNAALGHQFIMVSATASDSNGAATLYFFWADADSQGTLGAGKIMYDTATLTASALRQSLNTGADGYVCSVVFAISGKNTLDIFGIGRNKKGIKLYVGCQALTGTNVVVRIAAGRAI